MKKYDPEEPCQCATYLIPQSAVPSYPMPAHSDQPRAPPLASRCCASPVGAAVVVAVVVVVVAVGVGLGFELGDIVQVVKPVNTGPSYTG